MKIITLIFLIMIYLSIFSIKSHACDSVSSNIRQRSYLLKSNEKYALILDWNSTNWQNGLIKIKVLDFKNYKIKDKQLRYKMYNQANLILIEKGTLKIKKIIQLDPKPLAKFLKPEIFSDSRELPINHQLSVNAILKIYSSELNQIAEEFGLSNTKLQRLQENGTLDLAKSLKVSNLTRSSKPEINNGKTGLEVSGKFEKKNNLFIKFNKKALVLKELHNAVFFSLHLSHHIEHEGIKNNFKNIFLNYLTSIKPYCGGHSYDNQLILIK